MVTPLAGRPQRSRLEPLWDRIDKNRVKLAAYVAAFVVSSVAVFDALFVVFGGCLIFATLLRLRAAGEVEYLLGVDPQWSLGLPSVLFALVAVGWATFTLLRSDRWFVKRLSAKLVPKGELLDTKMALKDMAIAAGLPVAPALYRVERGGVNACVFQARKCRAIVCVTDRFVERLTIDEQRAVFANLVARLVSGDVIVDAGVAALLGPLHAWRERSLERDNRELDRMFGESPGERNYDVEGPDLAFFFFGLALAIVGDLVAFGHRRKQLRAAEKADAEGMLLLKDPASMLSALERCVELDNHVPAAGEGLADLFYCWSGVSTNDEDDPEWERVARLREVLGVEGWVPEEAPIPADEGWSAPPPPRLEDGASG